ncbi:MAG: ABC transporter ATP-binding protein [Oscillospiraceae bacterium]|nr:ABC transporter ATP-binding protein [Oscillospiraceae bacterium]
MEVLRATGIKRCYNSGGEAFWALKGMDLAIEEKQLAIFRGISGSGKTTLMNILGALDPPTEGDVFFCGESIARASERKRDMLRRKEMGFVFQSLALVSMMTAYENVEFILRINGYPIKERKSRVEECLALVGLTSRMHHLSQELSGGEQQRVAIARAIAHRPKVIFADEPTAELDTITGLQVVKVFKDLTEQENVTVVLATHDPGLMFAADVLYEMEDGEIIR